MRKKLRKKLTDNRETLVSELDVSTSFLAKLLSKGVITEEHKAAIQAKTTPHDKVDTLIDTLERRPSSLFELFCKVLKKENSELHDLLHESKDENEFKSRQKRTASPVNTHTVEQKRRKSAIKTDTQHARHELPSCNADQEDDEINLENPSPTDIAEYNKGFEVVQNKLSGYIDLLNELPFCLAEYGIMTSDEADEFNCENPNATRDILKKMKNCLKQDPAKCSQILRALYDDDQMHIAKFIVCSGRNTSSPDRVLTKEERGAIDKNMFCLEKLVRPYVSDYIVSLVGLECITSKHRDWIFNWRAKNKDVYQMFEIMKRRSFKHLTIFNRHLIDNGHTIIADVLEKGGIVEITNRLQGIEDASIRENIERGIVEQLCGYVDDNRENQLNKEQKLFILELIALLYKHRIKFIGCYPTNSIALYFQCGTDECQDWLCKNEKLKNELNILYHILQPELYRFPNFELNVSVTNSSKKHSMNTTSQHKAECKPGVDVVPHKDYDDKADLRSRFLCEANMAKFVNKIQNLKQQCCNELTTKSYQLKIHRPKDDDIEEVVHKFYETETQSILNKLKPIKDQWRTLDFWDLVQSVNPRPTLKFVEKQSGQTDEPIPGNFQNHTAFERSIVLCCMFEDMMRNFGWTVGDTLDVEPDICNTVGKLMMQVAEQDRPSLLDCMQSSMMNIRAHGSKQDGDQLRTLLITKKKYNGSNLACILFEQMIIDNKDNNISWMRTVCSQFIDLVVQLIIEPDYQENIRWTLKYLMKLESIWSDTDICNLMKNGILMFQYRQDYFDRYLIRIRNSAIHPSLEVCLVKNSLVCLKRILYCRDENKLICFDEELHNEKDKSLDQVLRELEHDEVGKEQKESMKQIIDRSKIILEKYKDEYDPGIELERIRKSKQKDSVEVLSSCLAVTSMALYACNKFWPMNTQLVSYCLLVALKMQNRGFLLEILTGEGKSCVIAMVAATFALLGRTVDIITSSPVLSQRDAEEWRTFYTKLYLSAACNVEEIIEGDAGGYRCPIVYGTVETFARDILRTEFLLQDVRKNRTCDAVIVDEVDSMLIDQGVQCTYLSHDLASTGMSHFKPILALIWMHVSRLNTMHGDGGRVYYAMEPELFLVTLSRLSNGIDPLQILRLAEKSAIWLESGFADKYLSADYEEQKRLLRYLDAFCVNEFLKFAVTHLGLYVEIIRTDETPERTSILVFDGGLTSVIFPDDLMKKSLTNMIINALSYGSDTSIFLPLHLREYCISRLGHWINNAFVAKQMKYGREYVVENNAIYPVDYKSTGVIEINKKWGDGLQQFLEMKHGLPQSPLSLITNFLSNIGLFERYGSNILGVSGTLGNYVERKFMDDTFSVEFATIPTSKRRKLFELDGQILKDEYKWRDAVSIQVKSAVDNKRAVLIICEDIATADDVHEFIRRRNYDITIYVYTKNSSDDEDHVKNILKPRDVVITTNLGARGSDFVTDDIVNKNGGLFVLVTFIPMNDRVEKQAFGRTGRRGATGSCQIIAYWNKMPEWLRECETVDEAKRLRDSIEMIRLHNTNEVDMMRYKQTLFREYCELKKKFVTLSNCDLDDLNLQVELLDDTWAKWLQGNEARIHESNHGEMVEDLRQIIEVCSQQAGQFDSDNIYHLMKFGAVRLMKGDFEGATNFFDRVVLVDPAWSAFAHYNRAYCTIQLKDGGYVRRAIDDLRATLRKLKTYKQTFVFSKVHVTLYAIYKDDNKNDDDLRDLFQKNIEFSKYYTMMECQLLHHIDTQIIETIEKLETIEKINEEVETECRNILDLILNVDCAIKNMYEEYRQLGLLFTFNIGDVPNIDEKPEFCYEAKIVSSLVVLEAVSDILLRLAFQRVSLNVDYQFESKYINELLCNIGIVNDDSLAWMSRCVVAAVTTGIHSITFMTDVSSSVLLKKPTIESSFRTDSESSQLSQVSCTQASHWLTLLETTTQDMKKLICLTEDELILHITNVVMSVLVGKIGETFHEKLKPGQNLHRELCTLYGSVTSQSTSDLQQFVDCIRHLALAYYPQICDANFKTVDMTKLATDCMSNSLNGGINSTDMSSVNTEISVTAAEIDITTAISKISDSLADSISTCIQNMEEVGYINNHGAMLEATNKVLTSVCSDIIRSMVHSRIYHAVMLDLREKTMRSFSSIYEKLINAKPKFKNKSESKYSDIVSRCSSRVEKRMYEQRMRSTTETHAILLSEFLNRSIIILDVDKEVIVTYSSPEYGETLQLVYNPPCCEFPGGHYDVYEDGKVIQNTRKKIDEDEDEDEEEDDDLLYSAIATATGHLSFIFLKRYILARNIENPRRFVELLASDHYACQLKHGRALLRLNMNHHSTLIDQSKHEQLDSSHLSCIEQALKSKNVSRLAMVLARYESKSKSAEESSPGREIKVMTSQLSRDACGIFLTSGRSVEAEVYRELVVERINDGDITTALQLCCIGHQMLFGRNIMDAISSISEPQTLIDTFERMNKSALYAGERIKFLSICDEWCKVLEPRGLMNTEQEEMLRKWITERQYANIEDSVVSMMIEECSIPKKEEQRRKQEVAKQRKENRLREKYKIS